MKVIKLQKGWQVEAETSDGEFFLEYLMTALKNTYDGIVIWADDGQGISAPLVNLETTTALKSLGRTYPK